MDEAINTRIFMEIKEEREELAGINLKREWTKYFWKK